MSITVIVNESSGTAEEEAGAKLESLFAEAGGSADVRRMKPGDDISATAREAVERGIEVVVAGGGDGTINAVAAEVAGTDATLGVLPLGTLNHFAKDLGIPLDVQEAVDVIAHGRTLEVDVARVNGVIFINNSSIGLYPRIVHAREEWQRRHGLGKGIALVLAVFDVLRRYSLIDVQLEVDGATRRVRSPFVFVGNNEYGIHGTEIGSRSALTDGVLCVFVAHRVGRLRLLALLLRALVGRLRDAKDFDIYLSRSVCVETRQRTVDVSTDGEVQRMESPLEYEILPGRLRVLVPRAGTEESGAKESGTEDSGTEE